MNSQGKGQTMKAYDVTFYDIIQVDNGVASPARVGLGQDGTLWLDPNEVGIPPDQVKRVAECRGSGPMLLLDQVRDCIYVNAQAIARTEPDPKTRQEMTASTNNLLELLHRRKLHNATLRSN